MDRLFRAPAYAFCLFMAMSGVATASSDSIGDDLTKLNALLQVATKNYDTATLKRFITDDYELVSPSGKVYDRAAFLADAADRSAVYEILQPEAVSVRSYNGDCAIVTATLHARYRVGARTVDVRVRYADVWIKFNGTWHVANGQASPIKTPRR
jgi:ketosteroid isomerase-like protein